MDEDGGGNPQDEQMRGGDEEVRDLAEEEEAMHRQWIQDGDVTPNRWCPHGRVFNIARTTAYLVPSFPSALCRHSRRNHYMIHRTTQERTSSSRTQAALILSILQAATSASPHQHPSISPPSYPPSPKPPHMAYCWSPSFSANQLHTLHQTPTFFNPATPNQESSSLSAGLPELNTSTALEL